MCHSSLPPLVVQYVLRVTCKLVGVGWNVGEIGRQVNRYTGKNKRITYIPVSLSICFTSLLNSQFGSHADWVIHTLSGLRRRQVNLRRSPDESLKYSMVVRLRHKSRLRAGSWRHGARAVVHTRWRSPLQRFGASVAGAARSVVPQLVKRILGEISLFQIGHNGSADHAGSSNIILIHGTDAQSPTVSLGSSRSLLATRAAGTTDCSNTPTIRLPPLRAISSNRADAAHRRSAERAIKFQRRDVHPASLFGEIGHRLAHGHAADTKLIARSRSAAVDRQPPLAQPVL